MTRFLSVCVAAIVSTGQFCHAFVPSSSFQRPLLIPSQTLHESALSAAGGKKKRRRRKQPPSSPVAEGEQPVAPTMPESLGDDLDEGEKVNVDDILDVAKFEFDGEIGMDEETTETDQGSAPSDNTAIPLPDIREALKKKQVEDEMARIEEEEAATKVKIKRSDKKALTKLLEQDPYADADDSFFEEEEYNTVSALLGERAKLFLGIPTGPLQVGHFIGALVIVLMAFVEYPGFPLTNLPSPLRGALQGGLGTVYGINILLAIAAVFKAGERGQPAALWVAKTFTVGGLAFDQLTQLPTLEQVEAAKARKGKRALKNRKK